MFDLVLGERRRKPQLERWPFLSTDHVSRHCSKYFPGINSMSCHDNHETQIPSPAATPLHRGAGWGNKNLEPWCNLPQITQSVSSREGIQTQASGHRPHVSPSPASGFSYHLFWAGGPPCAWLTPVSFCTFMRVGGSRQDSSISCHTAVDWAVANKQVEEPRLEPGCSDPISRALAKASSLHYDWKKKSEVH